MSCRQYMLVYVALTYPISYSVLYTLIPLYDEDVTRAPIKTAS